MDEFVLRRPFLTERAEGDPDLVQRVGAIHPADGFLGCWEEAMHAAFDEVFQHEPALAAEMLAGDADVVAQARPHGDDAEPVGAEEGFAGGAHFTATTTTGTDGWHPAGDASRTRPTNAVRRSASPHL